MGTGLTILYLYNNDFTGTIPSEIGLMTGLTNILFENNDFTGTIPSEIGVLTDLNSLHLSNNLLTGSIPSEVEALEAYFFEYVAPQKDGTMLSSSNDAVIL